MNRFINPVIIMLSLSGANVVLVAFIVLLMILILSFVIGKAMVKRVGGEFTIAFWAIAAGICAMITTLIVLISGTY
ncbi:MAG TPA: hypothetical protein VFG10_09860 [Saprospiraceae bacterium]|nr:hypothetical protein [Saprospiraceae bacterium]